MMISDFVENVLLDISMDYRVHDGIFDINKKDHIEILREYLLHKEFDEGFVSEYIDVLIEGKFPERQAYNENGRVVTFSSVEAKKDAVKDGTHFENDPTHKKHKESEKKEKSNSELDSKKKEKKSEKDSEKEDGEKKDKKSSSTKKSDKKDDDEDDASEKKEPNITFQKEKPEKSEEDTPRKDDWKINPEDTRKRAEALGWTEDAQGNWYCDTEFVAITSKDGYVIPIKDGDKNSPSEWPTHRCEKNKE